MSPDRPRRPSGPRDAAEAAFKAVTTKPAELPAKKPAIPLRNRSRCAWAATGSTTPRRAAPAGRTASTTPCARRRGNERGVGDMPGAGTTTLPPVALPLAALLIAAAPPAPAADFYQGK